jgi:pyrimidine-nucleoside phosphorylase
MSGRGLGHTGGTLDKLESIPGFSVSLAQDALLAQLLDIGVVVTAQSADVDPADKKMYALRDVTGTVQSIPLIVGSIISKKVAGGANAIVLDVKVGSGAFMKTEEEARALAHELQRVGELLGRKVVCVMTDMSQPLGMAVGNSVEVCEAIRTLKGDGPADLTELCLALGAKMLVLGGVADDEVAGRSMLLDSIASGAAIERFSAWIEAQGGDPRVVEESELLPLAQYVTIVDAPRSGYITGFDAEGVGRSAMLLGAGRETKESQIDLGAGLVLQAKIGDAVQAGRPIATLYASDEMLFDAAREKLLASVMIGDEKPEPPVLFHEV